MVQWRLHGALAVALSTVTFGGCTGIEPAAAARDLPLQTLAQPIRPTEGEGVLGNGWGDAPAAYLDSPQGNVRVWYATEGRHRPLPGDTNPANGVPDYVELVARVADDVWAHTVARGWRVPLPDDVLHDGVDFGGDGRFDVYLVDTNGGDGYLITEACTAEVPVRCAGYMAIENDFVGYGYPSTEVAVTVLVSHEFFHAVQNAYTNQLPVWLSEATATWFEHDFVPGQRDMVRLASLFFEEPERGLNSRSRGPADAFVYGTAVFALFLDEQFGADALQEILTQIGDEVPVEAAIQAAIEARGTAFDDAFVTFTAFNLFTGRRAQDGLGYSLAAEFPVFDLEVMPLGQAFDLTLELDPWASRTVILPVEAAMTVSVEPLTDERAAPRLDLLDPTSWPSTGQTTRVAEQETVRLDGPRWLVLTNPDPANRTAARVRVRTAPVEVPIGPEPPPTPDPGPAAASGDDDGCRAAGGAGAPWASTLLLAALLGGRRRRPL